MKKKSKEKRQGEMTTDGVLDYGVNVGRFVFEEEGYTVYKFLICLTLGGYS